MREAFGGVGRVGIEISAEKKEVENCLSLLFSCVNGYV